jgi:hypothetical protein
MKKKDWGNSVWILFHTLAHKLKPEYSSEVSILFSHINSICSNLPCPDCQEHATSFLSRVNKRLITSSRETLIQFLCAFHNTVNKRLNTPQFPSDALNALYSKANTRNVVAHFIGIMNSNMNNDKLMMNSFRRQNYMNSFIKYIGANSYKYNP